MSLLEPDPPAGDPRRLALEGARTADRLRTLSLVRLAAPLGEGSTRAAAAFALAQDLADTAADLAGRPRRGLPGLPDAAAGDVVAVCVGELVEVLVAAPAPAEDVSADAVGRLVALRAQL